MLDHLVRRPDITDVYCVGFCIGGHLAFRAAFDERVAATVCFYPTGLHDGKLGGDADSGTLARAADVAGRMMVVFGSNDKLVKSLQDGTIDALVVQDPFRMGYDGVKTALAASRGEKVPATIDTGANLITKANMSSARSQELLNPKIN